MNNYEFIYHPSDTNIIGTSEWRNVSVNELQPVKYQPPDSRDDKVPAPDWDETKLFMLPECWKLLVSWALGGRLGRLSVSGRGGRLGVNCKRIPVSSLSWETDEPEEQTY